MMRWHIALRAPLHEPLSGFSQHLHAAHIPHRISEERGEQVLWVADADTAASVRDFYQRYRNHPDQDFIPAVPSSESVRVPWQTLLKRSPVVLLVLLCTVLVALWTQLGSSLPEVAQLTFNIVTINGFLSLQETLDQKQWWRLLTPMLLHFGWLHLAMNMLWFWELGRRIEFQQGSLFFLGIVLITALVSNFSQYWFSGSAFFGGLSGVLYGLLGYCWIYQRFYPVRAYVLPKGVIGMMLVWLLVCLLGVITALGFGQIANAAHVSGLLAGCVGGALMGLLARVQNQNSV